MGPSWPILATFVALLAGAFVGAVLVALGLLGRVDLSRPRCRRCHADLRSVAWSLAGDTGGMVAARPMCPGCGVVLGRRAVRWRPFPVRRRLVALGFALLVVCPALHLWGSARVACGLTWRELLPMALELSAARRLGYPDPQGSFARGSPLEHAWGGGPWRSLNRRASAGLLSSGELSRIAEIIDQTADGIDCQAPFQRAADWPAPHADLLMAILRSDVDAGLRQRAASILVSAPSLVVAGTGAGGLPECGDQVSLTLESPGAGQLWGDISQCTGRAHEFRLDSLFFVREVRLDGRAVPFAAQAGRFRSGTMAMHELPQGRGWSCMPAVSCSFDATPGWHEVEVEVDMAVVDHHLAAALIDAQGEPGPPDCWGERAVVRRVVLRADVFLFAPARGPRGDVP